MAKLKIKDFKGIFTNIDENDQNLDTARTSVNWKHERGGLEFEPRSLSEYTLPEIDPVLHRHLPDGTDGLDWEWETGIYTTLTNDPFARPVIGAKYDVLIVIAKAIDNIDPNLTHRLIYLKDLTNDSIWYELSKYGNLYHVINYTMPYEFTIEIENHDGAGGFGNSLFSTTVSGTAYIKIESGRAKVYLPHDAFWVGRLDRKLYLQGTTTTAVHADEWHIDRLVEPFDNDNLTITDYDPAPPGTYRVTTGNPREGTGLSYRWFTTTGPGRRNGIKWGTSIITDPNAILETRVIILGDLGTNHDATQKNNDAVQYVSKCYQMTVDGEIVTNPLKWPGSIPDTSKFYFPFTHSTGMYICIDTKYFDYFRPSDMSWADKIASLGVGTAKILDTNLVQLAGSGNGIRIYGEHLNITEAAFEALSLEWTNAGKVRHIGFDVGPTAYAIVATAVYDDREELILDWQEGVIDLDPAITKFAFDIDQIIIPYDFNKRTTRYRFYIKLYDETGQIYLDFDQCQDFDLFEDINNMSTNFYVSQSSTQEAAGTTLSANIGIYFDERKPEEHIVVTNFRDYITSQGISLALKTDDYVNIYYSSLGGGNLMPDLVYSQSLLPVYGESIINAVSSVNKNFAAFTDNTMYILKVIQETGLLVFTLDGVLEFGVKNQHDISQIQGGVVINTIHGIYTTTGFQSNLISQPIDNIVIDNFLTSKIYYNKYKHILYFQPTISEDLYRFRFKDNVWELINKSTLDPAGQPILTVANDVLVDPNGELAYLTPDKLYVYDITDTTQISATLITSSIDFGEPSIDKLLNFVDADYIGQFSITFTFDGAEHSPMYVMSFPQSAVRTTLWKSHPLVDRIPHQKFAMKITSITAGTKIYGLELDYGGLRRRRYN